MDRPTNVVTLPVSQFKAYLYQKLKYGEALAIEKALFEATTVLEGGGEGANSVKTGFRPDFNLIWTRKKLMVVVQKFTDDKGVDVPVSDAFLDDLDEQDGRFLAEEVEKILTESKKKQATIEST